MNCPHCGHEIAAPAGVTGRQKEVLDFVRSFIELHGISPSYAEIAAGLGLKSPSRVHWLVKALADRGHITLSKHVARSIALVAA